MLLRGASFSSTICSWFCKLEALFVSNTSHTLRAVRHQQQGLRHLFQTTAQCDPLHPLTTNHTMFDDVVNPLLERFLSSGSVRQFHCSPGHRRTATMKRLKEEEIRRTRPDLEAEVGAPGRTER